MKAVVYKKKFPGNLVYCDIDKPVPNENEVLINTYAGWGLATSQLVGNLLFPQKVSQEGPRVGDLSVQASTYGTPIPIFYGTMRAAGNVIFCPEKREVKNSETSGGKGGPKVTTTTYTYNVDIAIALCEGPIAGIRKIFSNGKLVYDASEDADAQSAVASALNAQGWKVYLGDEDQLPDPTIEATIDTQYGAGSTPAYRGVAYIVFDHLDCPNGQIPQMSFEVVASGSTGSANPVFGQPPGTTTPATMAAIIEKQAWQFQATESASEIRSVGPGYNRVEGSIDFAQASAFSQFSPIPCQGGPFAIYCWFEGSTYGDPVHLTAVALDGSDGGGPVLSYVPVTSENALRPLYAAYDSVSGKFCAVADIANGADRASYITIMPSGTLTALLDTDSCPMAFYDDIIYTCAQVGGLTRLNKYDGTTGALIGYVEAAGDYGAASLLVHASASGVYVLDGANYSGSTDRRVWKVSDTDWTLLTSTARFDNNAGNAITWWSNDEYGIAGPSGVDGDGNVTYRLMRYLSVTSTDVTVGDVIEAICERAGCAADQVDASDVTQTVHGYGITQVTSGRDALSPLLRAFFVDSTEIDGTLKFTRRAGKSAVATIPFADLGCVTPGDEAADPFPLTRAQEAGLPRSVALTFINAEADYQPGTETARRQVTESAYDVTDQLPMATTSAHIATVAATLLYDSWAQRTTRKTKLPRTYAFLDVGDNVTVEYPEGSYSNKRFTMLSDDGAMLDVEMVDSDPDVYSASIPGASPAMAQAGVEYYGPTLMQLMDIPLLRDADDSPGLYAAVESVGGTWPGAIIYAGADESHLAPVGGASASAVVGVTNTALANWLPNQLDERNTVDVQVHSGTLSSITRDEVLDTNTNACVLGDEIIQFRSASALGGGAYRLSGLRRGLRGTEWARSTHAAGERFVLLAADGGVVYLPMTQADVGLSRAYRALTIGQRAADAATQTLTSEGASLKPLAPAMLELAEYGATVYARWARRSRYADNWLGGVVPLAETSESYEVDVDYGGVRSTYTASSPELVIPLSGAFSQATVTVYQIALGRGFGTSASVSVSARSWVDGRAIPIGKAGSKVLAQKYESGEWHLYESADDGLSYSLLGVTPRLTAYGAYRAMRSDGVYVSILGESVANPAISTVTVVVGTAGSLPGATAQTFTRGSMPASVGCDSTTFLIITEGNGVYSSPDGETWTHEGTADLPITLTGAVSTGGFASNYFGTALVYAAGRWFMTFAQDLYYTEDPVALTGWTACSLPTGVSATAYNIAALGSQLFIRGSYYPGEGFAGTAVMLRSTDSGSTWTTVRGPVEQGERPQSVSDLFMVGSSLIAVLYDYGAASLISGNGTTWTKTPNGITFMDATLPISTGTRLIVDGMRWSTDGVTFTAATGI